MQNSPRKTDAQSAIQLFSCEVKTNSSVTPGTIACQAPMSMGFPRQEYWSRLPFPSPGIFLIQGLNPDFLHWQVDSLPLKHQGICIHMKVKVKVTQSCLFVTQYTIQSMGFSRPEYWSGQPLASPGDLSNPGIKPRSPELQADSLPVELQGKPRSTGVGSRSLLQSIFPTQESNRALLHCRRILYQLSYQGSYWQPYIYIYTFPGPRTHFPGGHKDPLEEAMASQFSILAWRILWTEKPGGLQCMGFAKSWT